MFHIIGFLEKEDEKNMFKKRRSKQELCDLQLFICGNKTKVEQNVSCLKMHFLFFTGHYSYPSLPIC